MIKTEFTSYKICIKNLDFGRMHTNKNMFLYFLNKEFWIFFLYFSEILKKKRYI
jgi:hypothetical protein